MRASKSKSRMICAAAVTGAASVVHAGVLFQDNFESAVATPFTLAQQIANPALQSESDPNNTTGIPNGAQPGQWYQYAKTTTAPFNIQVTNNVDFTATGSYEGSNVLRFRRSPEPPSSTSAMAAYFGMQSSGTVKASFKMMFPDQHTIPIEPFGITFPVHFFFTPYVDNDHSDGTSPDGQKTPIIILNTPTPGSGNPNSFARTYYGGVAQNFPPGSGSINFTDVAGGDPQLFANQWQQWSLEANIDAGTFTFTVDGITSDPQPFNFLGGFSALNFRVGEAQAPLDPSINGTFFLDDLKIERLDPRWNVNASGNWTDSANWNRPVPNSVGAGADFTDAILASRTVTVDAPITVGLLTFDNANSYSVVGTNTLTIDNTASPASVSVLSGSHTISAPVLMADTTNFNIANASSVLTMSGTNSFGGGTDILKNGPGTLAIRGPRVANIDINGGTLQLVPDGTVEGRGYTITTDLAGGATPTVSLDLTNNAFVLDYQTDSPLNAVVAQIQAAFAGGAWTSLGIKTTMGAGYGVGYAEIGELSTVPAIFGPTNSTMVLLRGTLFGDANLTGNVDLDDFTALAANFGQAGSWTKGDFNYDGNVNLDDFTALAANFGRAAAADGARASVPEPAGLALIAIGGAFIARRRRA